MVVAIIINYLNDELTISYVKKELSKIDSLSYVIIVNNKSTDESDRYLARELNATVVDDNFSSHNRIFILPSVENLGFARGNNIGAKFAKEYLKAEYLLFSNNDILINQSNILVKMVDMVKNNPEIGVIGPKIIGLDGRNQSPESYQSFWKRYVWMYLATPLLSKRKKAALFDLDYAEKAAEGFHYKVMGAFFMMRTDDFFSIGGMDPNTFLYSEETILSERLNKIGKRAYFYPQVSVIHAHGVTTNKTIGKKGINKYLMESEAYYYNVYRKIPMWQIRIGLTIYKIICKLKK